MARAFRGRKFNTRVPNKIIRIYTEGERTEPNYFNAIRNELQSNLIKIQVFGMGNHTLPLVDYVINKKDDDIDTEWWVVFDADGRTNFNQAVETAVKNNINVAYSNECFELWFLLHFDLITTSVGRKTFPDKLSKKLGFEYQKNSDIYNLIKDKENIAIQNAKKLEVQHNNSGITSFTKRDPSTTVFKLVERLRSL